MTPVRVSNRPVLVLTLKPLHCPLLDHINEQPGVTLESHRKVIVGVGDPMLPVERPGGGAVHSMSTLLLIFAPSVSQGVKGILTMLGNVARADPLGRFRDTRQAERLATRRGRLTSRTAGGQGCAGRPFTTSE